VGNLDNRRSPKAEPLACLICGDSPLNAGAFWLGQVERGVGYVGFCRTCIEQGKLGALIGDALAATNGQRADRVEAALERTARTAYRALAIHDDHLTAVAEPEEPNGR
jgi:hypothetical protein